MKKLLAGLALAALTCTASPLTSESKIAPEKKSPTLQGAALRAATRVIYNAGAIDTNKPLLPQAMAAISTPEPNANFLIGTGLLGVAYLLQRKTKQSR